MKKVISTVVFFIVTWAVNAQAILTVDNSGFVQPDYTSLQEAIDAATPNDLIYVYGGQGSYGNIIINKPVNIIGPGYFLADNYPLMKNKGTVLVDSISVVTGANNCYISGLSFYHFTLENVSNIIIRGCKTHYGWTGSDDEFVTLKNTNHVTIVNNYFSLPYGSQYIHIDDGNSNLTFENNVFLGCDIKYNYNEKTTSSGIVFQYNIFSSLIGFQESNVRGNIWYESSNTHPFDPYGTCTIENNVIIHRNIPGNTIIEDNVTLFVGYPDSGGYSPDSKFMLKENSPAKGVGPDGTDCGIFGGPHPYVFSGIPSIPYITELVAPLTARRGDTIQVHIKARVGHE